MSLTSPSLGPQLWFNSELWARTDMTPESRMHTSVVLGLSRIVAFDALNPDNTANGMPANEESLRQQFGINREEAAAVLGRYLELYAKYVDPFEAAEEAAKCVQGDEAAA